MAKKPFSIEEYRAKRDFRRTPEPAPKDGPSSGPRPLFVVQRHEASHLHYDLRLEMDGVLKSFAVPKGFSYIPGDKHLAVRTEDHPMEYMDFQGVIPKGEYGAGTMAIWDRGFYEWVADPDNLDAKELKMIFYGGRLRGEWHMVKLKDSTKDWLLFKRRDRYARDPGDAVFPLDLSQAPPVPLPKRPRMMQATDIESVFDDQAWFYELEFAGRRLLAGVDQGEVRFWSGTGARARLNLPRLERQLCELRAETALLDGVLVALDEQDRPDPDKLVQCLEDDDTDDLVFYAFDLLHYEDWDLRTRFPLLERKRALRSIVPNAGPVLYVDHVIGRGSQLMTMIRQTHLAGLVAKHSQSHYRAGVSKRWQRVPNDESQPGTGQNVFDTLAKTTGDGRALSARVKITNRNKVYWPVEGWTKGQLLDYYDQIADVILPYLQNRPIHMLRYPDGIEGKNFYHKKIPDHLPDWIETVEVGQKEGEAIHYMVCNDRDTLLYLINLGSIDLHPWMSQCDSMESPDYAVLDLDPTVDDFSKVIRIAQSIGRRLRGAGLRPLLKTSGASGLHIYVPLQPGYTYEHSRMFCELVARMTVQELGSIATVERSVANRESKVYVDFLQNIREQTIVPPYVARPVQGAQVSAPLEWDELRSDLRPSQFDIFNMPERLARLGDLFAGLVDDRQDLLPALDALQDQ